MTETVEIGEVDRNHGVVIGSNKLSVETMYVLHLAGQQTGSRVRARQWFSRRRLTDLSGCFVEPAGFARAQAVLADRQSVLLAGSAGTGRVTAAAVLLHRVGGASRIRLVDVNLSGDEEPVLDVEQVHGEESLLLDLSTLDMTDFLRVAGELEPLMIRVTEVDSLLAIVLPDYERQLPAAIEHGVRVELTLTPELARRIFERHVTAHGVTPGAPNPALAAMFATPRAGELAELANLVAQSSAAATSWGEALRAALDELSARSAELTEMFAKHPDAAWRSLLVSVALLDGGPADAVFESDRELLRLLDFPESEEHPLARSGLTARLAEVGAEMADGRVRFVRPRYGDAVLTYVWRNFPGLRPNLTRWVQRVPRLARAAMTDGDRATVAERFADVAMRHGSVAEVLYAIEKWSTGNSRTSALAVRVLGAATVDSRHGWKFRRRVYGWARDPAVSPRLAGVLISVCENVLGPAYPEAAMIRLHHLTAHRDDTVGLEAIEALLRLATGPRERAWLLDRVVTRLRNGVPGRDAALFGRLVDPTALPDHDLVVTAWYGVLGRADGLPVLREWLSTSDDTVLELLVRACYGQTSRLGRLRAVAVAWVEEDPPARQRIGRRLDVKIDSVLDLARTAPGGQE
jgi:hypothetical protein